MSNYQVGGHEKSCPGAAAKAPAPDCRTSVQHDAGAGPDLSIRENAPVGPTSDRSLTLGASEIAAVAGMAKYRTALDVWASKRGLLREEPEVFDRRSVGKVLERPLLEHLYAPKYRLTLAFPGTLTHREEEWASATPDAVAKRVVTGPGLQYLVFEHDVEAKIVGGRQQQRWTDDDGQEAPPVEVHCQVLWQMWVLRSVGVPVEHGEVVALMGTDLKVFRVEWDGAFVADLATIGRDFWRKHVVGGEMPVADGSEKSRRVIEARWRKAEKPLLPMPDDVLPTAQEYYRLGEEAAELKDRRDALGNALRVKIADAQGYEGGGLKAVWREQKARVDYRAYAESLGATEAGAEAFRGENVRVLDVREVKAK